MVLKRVGPVSCAKVMGLLYAIMGFFFGAILSVISLVTGFASNSTGAMGFGAVGGIAAIIALPLFYGVLGFVITLIGAALFNLLAGIAGGIEMDFQ